METVQTPQRRNCKQTPIPANLWAALRNEAAELALSEPVLADIAHKRVLDTPTLTASLARLLAEKLNRPAMETDKLEDLFNSVYAKHKGLEAFALEDIAALRRHDPAAQDFITPYLFFKGFHALQTHRLAHALWQDGRKALAFFLQSRMSIVFGVDIHPAATIGHGVTFDHASGVVIGETARIGNNVLILHGVTLGGRGDVCGDRHPIIGNDVTIGACAQVIGRIVVGDGAFVAAGSLVVKPVAPHTTVAGVPAKVINQKLVENA